jgi:hypothetical protein
LVQKEEIVKTTKVVKNGIVRIDYYVNRSIRQGDPHGGSRGIMKDGKEIITEMEFYHYTKTK